MKKIVKPLLILSGMIVMLFVLAMVINLPFFDEKLIPEVQAVQDIKAKPYQSDNAYPALAGFSYYSDMTFQLATEKIRNQLNQNITETGEDYLTVQNWKQLNHDKISSKTLNLNLSCNTHEDRNCFRQYIDIIQKKPITNSDSKKLINRYSQLINYNNYSGATQVDFQTHLEYGPLLKSQRLFLIQHYLNNTNNFSKPFLKDLTFWRMILKNSNLLLTKMVSVAAIHSNIQIMAYAIQSGKLSNDQLLEIQKHINNGLTKKEQSLLTTFQFETKGAMYFFDLYNQESDDFFGKLFYQPQATFNLHYMTSINPLLSIDQLDDQSFYHVFQTKEWPIQPNLKSVISLYNPTGKSLIHTTIAAYQDYFARIHDLDAMLTLLNLRIELALNNDQNIASVINNSDHKNPYTDKPFNYNSANQTIGFDCLGRVSVCEIAL